MIIGIDFGTCFSSIAVMQSAVPMDNLTDKFEQHLGSNAVGIPTLFMFSKEFQREMYGIECLSANPYENPEVIKYMKRKVREDPQNIDLPCPSGGVDYLLRNVIEKYLAYLIKSVKEAAVLNGNFDNTNIEAITITTPIGIASGQMMATDYNHLLKEILLKLTGLPDDKVRILGEPVAAAICYLYEEDLKKKIESDRNIMVLDLGGGTFDVTIVKYDPHKVEYEILVKEGDLELGGKDWDSALGEIILKKLDLDTIDSDTERGLFWDTVGELKINLSRKTADARLLEINGEQTVITCTREEFEQATASLKERAAKVVEKAVSEAGGIDNIDTIVLVGGSSNMPQIKEMIFESYPEFDKNSVLVHKPSKAIARGAAIFAKLNFKNGSVGQASIVDSSTTTYGFKSRRGGKDLMIYNPILKGTKFTEGKIHAVGKHFHAIDNEQTSIVFEIYESQWMGENSISGPGDNDHDPVEDLWMEFGNGETANGMEISVSIPPEYLGRARSYYVDVIFDLSADGILDITIVDAAGNKVGYTTNYVSE